jgi:hypothetical protein
LAVGVLLAGAAVTLAATGSARVVTPAQADPPPGTPAQPPSDWHDNTVPMGLEQAVESLGNGPYAASFGGIEVVNNMTQLAVYLTSPTAAIEHAFQQGAPAGMLVFRSTPNSLQQITAVHQRLESAWQSLIAQGIDVVDFGPNPADGQEDVGVENLTGAQAQELEAQFPAGTLNIHNETPADVNSWQLTASRANDTAPYNGSDDVSSSASACTTGFGVKISGNPRLVSAGHCFDSGSVVKNLHADGTGSGNAMGSVTNNGLGQFRGNTNGNDLDSLVFTGCNGSGTCGGSGLVWTGTIANPQRSDVSGVGTWADGDQVCESGAYSGELCDWSVARTDYCTTIGAYYLCNITRVNLTGESQLIEGDSGGPWFRFSPNLDLVGTTTGKGTGVAFFTGIHEILNHWNACVVTIGSGCVT